MSQARYRNFNIYVSPLKSKRLRYQVRVSELLPGGQIREGERETRAYDPAMLILKSGGIPVDLLLRLKLRTITEDQLYQLGRILADLLLPGSIRARLRESLVIVRERKERLRLRLVISVKELLPLPWEYVYIPTGGDNANTPDGFLALKPYISIVRHADIDEPEPRVERRSSYRLVAALSAPRDQQKINVAADRKAIANMVKKLKNIGEVRTDWVECATRKSLRDSFREEADIFHFAGHGYFDGKSGQIILDK